jgi:Domain of unknown function (DUF4129)
MILVGFCHLAWAIAVLGASGESPAVEQGAGFDAPSPVRAALREEAYPWYDPDSDQVRPLLPDPSSWRTWLGDKVESFFRWLDKVFGAREAPRVGNPSGLIPTLAFLIGGCLFLILLWRLWRLHQPGAVLANRDAARIGEAARVAGLADAPLEHVDPWAEAVRLRAEGDLAGAVIWLFFDQLLGLERVGLVRLTPGRTARQYASSLEDPLLAGGLRATLGLFEQVSYGHRLPSHLDLDRLWPLAESFRRRLQTIAKKEG